MGSKVRQWYLPTVGFCVVALLASWHVAFGQKPSPEAADAKVDQSVREYAIGLLAEGMRTFRFDTFGSEEFWGGKLKLHRSIEGEKNSGTGPGLSPKKALELNMDAVPKEVAAGIKSGKVDLNDPANTLALLKAGAVVGVTGFFEKDGKRLKAVGIQCALCHSTVDDASKPGIGHRLDGWPNRDLDIGAIISLAPDLSAFAELLQVSEADVKKAITAWGPGKFDAELNLDGKAFRPDGKTAATLNPQPLVWLASTTIPGRALGVRSVTGMPMSAIWKCTAKVPSLILD